MAAWEIHRTIGGREILQYCGGDFTLLQLTCGLICDVYGKRAKGLRLDPQLPSDIDSFRRLGCIDSTDVLIELNEDALNISFFGVCAYEYAEELRRLLVKEGIQ